MWLAKSVEPMSQRAVERTLGRLVTDPDFRGRFHRDPERATLELGLELTPEEIDALMRIPAPALADLEARIDDRLCRLYLPDEPAAAK